MKKVILLLTSAIFLSSQLAYSGNNTLPTLIPKDDLEILQQKKEYEKYEWKSKVEGLKDQYEIDKQTKTIQKKKLKRTTKTEDIRTKELTEAEKMYKYYVPIQGIVGNVAIAQNDIALVERSYIGPQQITQISIKHIKVDNKPMRMYKNVLVDDIREKSIAEGTQGMVDVNVPISSGVSLPPPPPPPSIPSSPPSPSIPPSTPSSGLGGGRS